MKVAGKKDTMKHVQKALAAGLLTATSLGFMGTSRAVVYVEPADAGQTLATAANAGAATGFAGTLSSPYDADLYQFTVATAGKYTFSDVGGTVDTTSGGPLDTEISLFGSTGTALVVNDDANGTTFESALTTTLAAGTYYFGITNSGNEAINSNSQLLFNMYPGGDTTATRGAASGVNPTTLSTFNANSYTTDQGTYNVTITSAVPEPSTWAALVLSGVTLGVCLRRRQAQPA